MTQNNKSEIYLKNEYYPRGLSKGSIKRYYELNRKKILEYVKTQNTPCVLFMPDDSGNMIVKRKIKENLIYINSENYDDTFNGRVLSAAIELKPKTKKVVLDLDCKNRNIKESEKKMVLKNCLDKLKELYDQKFIYSKTPKVFITSSGYHIHAVYYKDLTPNELAAIFEVHTKDIGTDNIKIDYSLMRNRGCYVIPWCLNRNGLICADVTDKWRSVDRSFFRILY